VKIFLSVVGVIFVSAIVTAFIITFYSLNDADDSISALRRDCFNHYKNQEELNKRINRLLSYLELREVTVKEEPEREHTFIEKIKRGKSKN
jgi:hypothetical protein